MSYWAHGEGAAKIGWGSDGDFDRCVLHLSKYVRPDEVKGLCSNLHVKATGARPGHAPGETHHGSHRMAKYSAEELRQLGAKGQAFKDADGSFSYPIADAEDLQNAIHAVGRGNASHDALRKYIIGRAKALGKSNMIPDNWSSSGSLNRAEMLSTYTRSFALEDISIRSGGDGRTVEAYAACFNTPAPVHDQDGDYEEVIDPGAFNRAIEHARRAKGGWNIPVMFNHGMTMWSTPSERHSMPIGTPEEIHADSRGLFTRTRYHKTQLADEVLESIREGSITAYSFQGQFRRSDPFVPRGGFRAGRDGALPTVRRTESTLREFGPTPFPVYSGAEVVGVRAEQAAFMLGNLAPGEFDRLTEMFRSGTPITSPEGTDEDPPTDGTPDDSGLAAADPPVGHSMRSPKEELQARRAQFLIRHGVRNG
jgi:HK97 family phage prohead protease